MPRIPRPSTLSAVVAAVGLAALLALSPIGHGLFILGLVSVVGIPISILLAALPSIFLVLLAIRLAVEVRRGLAAGKGGKAVVLVLVLAVMADFFVLRAWRVADQLDDRAAALGAADIDELGPPGAIGTLAVLRNTAASHDTATPCDDLCQRLLLTGAVDRVLELTAAPPPPGKGRLDGRLRDWPSLDPSETATGTAWRFERRGTCPGDEGLAVLRPVHLPQPPRPRGTPLVEPIAPVKLMRLKIAGGDCLVGEPASLADADALLAYGTLHSGVSDFAAGFDAWADTLSAWRLAFRRRSDGRLVERYRRTAVRWAPPVGVLAPVILSGYQFDTGNGWLRSTRLRNRSAYEADPPVGAFVGERLGLDIVPRVEGSAGTEDGASPGAELRDEQAKAVDAILAGSGVPSPLETTLVSDYLSGLAAFRGRSGDRVRGEDAGRVLRIVEDRRIELPDPTAAAVREAVRVDPETASGFAAALAARLSAVPTAPDARERDRRIARITGAAARLPADALGPLRAQVVALMHDRERRTAATFLLGRLDGFGPEIVPEILAMMDDAAASRDGPGRRATGGRRWTEIWRAGAQSLCRLALHRPTPPDDLRRRAEGLAAQGIRVADEIVTAAMLRMGASEDDVRATLHVDPQDEKAMRSFGFTLRRARRDGACD